MKRDDHLDPEVSRALLLPRAERIAFAQADRWVGYTRASQILAQLDQLVIYPKTLRMPNVLVVIFRRRLHQSAWFEACCAYGS